MEKLIRALRCAATTDIDFMCPQDCPYRLGVDRWNSCDISRMVLEAAAALEKQIPKKPIMRKDVAETYYICPECEWGVDRFDDNYCSDCGQKLDWSSEK